MRLPSVRSRGAWLEPAVFLGLALLQTWPAALHPLGRALGSADADGMKHLWTLWWMRASVWQEGVLPFHTRLVNFPVGMDLFPIEPLNGLVAVLLPWVPVVLLSNLLVLANLVATGLAGAWFGRVLSGSRTGGLVAGTLLQGSAVMAFFVHVGVGELTHLWWLPLGLGALVRARQTGRWPWFGALAASLVGALLSCFYLGFFLALGVATAALATLWAGRRTPLLLLQYGLTAALALAVVWPVTQVFATSYRTGDVPRVGLVSYVLDEHGQPVTDPPSARLEPAQLVRPGRAADTREVGAYGGGRYLGLFALALAAVGLVRRPRQALPWLLVGLVGVLLATGTYLTVDGEVVRVGAGRVRMPLLWLNRALGYLAEPLNFPTRALALTATALAALGALAAGGLGGRRRGLALLAPLAVVEVAAFGLLGWPWATFTPRPTDGLEALAQGPPGALLDLALAVRSDNENRRSALAAQIAHGRALNSVPVERVEYFARDGQLFFRATTLFDELAPLYENVAGAAITGDHAAELALLREAGFCCVLVTYRSGRELIPTAFLQQMQALFGAPVARGPGIGVWALPERAVAPEDLAQARAAHAARMAELARTLPGMGRQLR